MNGDRSKVANATPSTDPAHKHAALAKRLAAEDEARKARVKALIGKGTRPAAHRAPGSGEK